MIVMKFGGTSVQDANAIERAATIVKGRLAQKPVVVVSAMSKVTDQLLAMARAGGKWRSQKPRSVFRGRCGSAITTPPANCSALRCSRNSTEIWEFTSKRSTNSYAALLR